MFIFTYALASQTITTTGITLGGSPDHFDQAVAVQTTPVSGDTDYLAAWVDADCAGGQTVVVANVTNATWQGMFTGTGLIIMELSGVASSSPVDVTSASSPGATGTTASSGTTAGTSVAGEMALGAVIDAETFTGTDPSYTNVTMGSPIACIAGYMPVPNAGTGVSYSAPANVNNVVAGIVFTLKPASTLTVTTASLPAAAVSTAYSTTLAAAGGTGSGYTWAVSAGSLPAGLSLNSSTGVISGTPNAAGTSNFTVQVTDSGSNTATQNLSITASVPGTYNLSVSSAGTATGHWGDIALVFTGTAGTGASSSDTGTGAPSLALTTTGDNSAIAVIVLDANAVSGASRTWLTLNGYTPTAGNGYELDYTLDSGNYGVYVAYYPDAGPGGSAKTVGLSAPSGMKYTAVAYEILGSPGGTGADTVTGTDAAFITATITAADAGTGTDTATGGLQVPAADTGAGTDTGTLTVATAVSGADTGTGVDTASFTLGAHVFDSAAGTDSAVITAHIAYVAADVYEDAYTDQYPAGTPTPITDTVTGSDEATISAGPSFPQIPLGVSVQLLVNGTWTDITSYVYARSDIEITRGRPDETQQVNPSQCTMTLDNRDGRFSPSNPAGAYAPYLTRNMQLRVYVAAAVALPPAAPVGSPSGPSGTATPVGAPVVSQYTGYRFWGEVASIEQHWDSSGTDRWVNLTAAGPLRRYSQGDATIGSAMHRYYTRLSGSMAPYGYWPAEDSSGAQEIASALSGVAAMGFSGTPSFGSDSSFGGSDSIPAVNGSAWHGQTLAAETPPGAGSLTENTAGTFTWTCPPGVTEITDVVIIGAGGGGGSWGTTKGGGGGGGGSSALAASIGVTAGYTYTYVVAGGGSPGASPGTSGDTAGISYFAGDTVTLLADGGIGGTAGNNSVRRVRRGQRALGMATRAAPGAPGRRARPSP